MERHYLEVKTVEAVASACHVELAYLCPLFRRFAHTAPYLCSGSTARPNSCSMAG